MFSSSLKGLSFISKSSSVLEDNNNVIIKNILDIILL